MGSPFFRRRGADATVQFVELDRFGSSSKPVQLEPVEVLGATAGLFEDAAHRAGVDIADVRCGLNRAAMSETLDDADDGLLGELGIPQQCPLPFGEPVWLIRYSGVLPEVRLTMPVTPYPVS